MRWCQFTPYLISFTGDPVRLTRHVERCEMCGVVARLLVAEVREGASGPTTDCPDDITLAAYAEGVLPPEETDRVGEHVAQCLHCLDRLRSSNGDDSTAIEEALNQADREIDAESLAEEIAAWFVQNHYPEDESAVDGLLSTTTSDPSQIPAVRESMEAATGFPFALAGRSRALQIVMLSRFAGSLLLQSGEGTQVADALAEQVPALKEAGFQDVLITLALQYLRDA